MPWATEIPLTRPGLWPGRPLDSQGRGGLLHSAKMLRVTFYCRMEVSFLHEPESRLFIPSKIPPQPAEAKPKPAFRGPGESRLLHSAKMLRFLMLFLGRGVRAAQRLQRFRAGCSLAPHRPHRRSFSFRTYLVRGLVLIAHPIAHPEKCFFRKKNPKPKFS